MTAAAVERALKKQRLQQESAQLRDALAGHARGVEPAFVAADTLKRGWQWLSAHPAVPVAIVVALVVARPSLVWRAGRNAWVGWQAWQRWRHVVLPAVSAVQSAARDQDSHG